MRIDRRHRRAVSHAPVLLPGGSFNEPDPGLGWRPQRGSSVLGLPFADDPLDPADPYNRWRGGIFAEWPHFDD